MKIKVRALTGETFDYNVDPCDSVAKLKKVLQKYQYIPVNDQRLIYKSQQLEDSKTLEDYGVKEEETIHLIQRLNGC